MMYSNFSLSIQEKEDRKNSFYLSVALHLILLILLLLIPLKKAISPDALLSGIVVDFGNPNAGQNNDTAQPMLAEVSEDNSKASEETVKEVTPTKQPAKKTIEKAPVGKIEAKIVEETSPIVASDEVLIEKQIKKQEKATPAKTNSKEKTAERSDAEKQAESKAKFGSLFGNGSEGTEDGKKGDEFGVPDAAVLVGMSKGTGETGDGLDSRGLVYEPKIEDNSQKSGKVVVKVCVNKDGDVSSAKFTQRGSSTTDSYLIALAEKSAKKYKFSQSTAEEQCGTITIDFIVK